MNIVLSTVVTLAIAVGYASALQKFGHPCGEAEKNCDSSLGLLCSETLKTCECQSLNSTESEKINLVWSEGECAVKVKDTCLITNSSASPSTENRTATEVSSTSAPAPTESASPLRCIQHANCINGTCQCIHGHQPSEDLSTCTSTKSGAFSITGIPLFVGLISMVLSIISL